MKECFNWRYYVIYALFTIGLMSLFIVFGDDDRPMGQWIKIRLYFPIISAVSFYATCRLKSYWESKGEITKFSTPEID